MPKQSAVNLDITNNADGFDISGGVTSRKLTVTGGDVAISGTGSATITFPTTSTTVAGLSIAQTFSAVQSFVGGFTAAGATFANDIYAPNMVTGVNGITGAVSITSGSNITITQSGKQITIASVAGSSSPPLATSSVTGVASFRAADFDVSTTGSVSLTGTVARTNTSQTFTGLQIFSSGISANGLTGTILTPSQTNITSLGTLTSLNTTGLTSTQRVTISSGGLSVVGNIDGTIGTAAQPNITSLGTLTSLNSAGLTSSQRINVSSGGIVIQAGGLSVTGGANLTGGSTFFGDIEVYDGAFIRTGGLSVTGGIAGTLVTPAQTNITSLGTLTSLTTSGLLSTQALNVVAGATFGIGIYAPNMVTGVNGITGAVSITNGSNVTITQSGNVITIASSGGGGGGGSDFPGGISSAGATFTAQVNMGSNTLYQPTLRYYNEPTSSPTIVGGGLTFDLSVAQIFTVTANANIGAVSISNTPSTASRAIGFTLILTADGTARGLTWGSAIKWANSDPPALTSTNNKKDVFSFMTTDGGTNWLGFIGGLNY